MKKLFIIFLIALVAGSIQLYRACTYKVPSRQEIALHTEQYKAESTFAQEVLRCYYENPRQFVNYWSDQGDVYKDSMKNLETAQMSSPEVKRVFCYKNAQQKIFVELVEPGKQPLVVCLWSANGKCRLIDIFPAIEKK